jgi:hypothetical protein
MKKIFLAVAILFACSIKGYCQIALPSSFYWVRGQYMNGCYFSDGTYNFSTYSWGHEGLTQEQVIKHLGYSFYKISNDFYWATGKDGDYYYYIILDGITSIKLISKVNGKKFSDYSTWLLNKVKYNKANSSDEYFTDSKGNDSFYYWNKEMGN